VWRVGALPGRSAARALLAPILARTTLTVKTRPNSTVTLEIGGKRYGPKPSGTSGEVDFSVLVGPGVTRGQTRVVDAKGLTTTKAVDVRPAPPYQRWVVALAAKPRRGDVLRVWAASVDPKASAPRLSLLGPRDQRRALTASQLSAGLWQSSIRLPSQAVAGHWRLQRAGDSTKVSLGFTLGKLVASRPATPPTTRPASQPTSRSVTPSRGLASLRTIVSLSGGLTHNTREFFSPRIAAAAGVDLRLGPGRLGLDLELALLWSTREELAPGDPLTTTLTLLPLSLLARYALSSGRWAPFVAAGPTLLITRVEQQGPTSSELRRTTAAMGFTAARAWSGVPSRP
jgi:hypothetical protein